MSNNLEKIRKKAFWLTDALKGGGIKKHLDEINSSIDTQLHDKLISIKLSSLIDHATRTVPFYKKYSNKTLFDFPVVDKSLMRNNNHFLSNSFNDSNRIPLVTSGSTGTPFKVYQDLNKKNRNSADTIYFANKAGFEIGNKLAYLKIWSRYNKKNIVQLWLQNILPLDVIKLDNQKISDFVNRLENDKSTFGILGYSSALDLLARYLENTVPNDRGKVTSIIAMSESLNDDTKSILSEYFKTQVVSRYSNIENGIIAQQEINGSKNFRINTASYFVEILKFDSDESVNNNELGRIVVTDLFNFAMPMIRYDTGDIGSFVLDNRNYFEKIEGRQLDQIYDTNGQLISSYIVYKNMWQYTEIVQYQFVQYGARDYLFKINADPSFNRHEQLTAEFKEYLGEDANFKIEFVNEIPLLSSGKRKKIINTFHNKK